MLLMHAYALCNEFTGMSASLSLTEHQLYGSSSWNNRSLLVSHTIPWPLQSQAKPWGWLWLTPCYDHDCLTAAMQPGFCAVGTMSHQNVSLNIINLTCRLNSFEIERNDTLPFVLPLTLSVQHYVLRCFNLAFLHAMLLTELPFWEAWIWKSVKATHLRSSHCLVLQSLAWRSTLKSLPMSAGEHF